MNGSSVPVLHLTTCMVLAAICASAPNCVDPFRQEANATLLGDSVAKTKSGALIEEPGAQLPVELGGQVRVSRMLGSSVFTFRLQGSVNAGSSLAREWVTVHDASLPCDLAEYAGLTTTYEESYGTGRYYYTAEFSINAREPIVAIEVRFLAFDIWGEFVRTLSLTEIKDLREGSGALSGTWNLFGRNECSQHYASIAYIARIRTADGHIIAASSAAIATVMQEAKRFSEKFGPQDLEPRDDKPQG